VDPRHPVPLRKGRGGRKTQTITNPKGLQTRLIKKQEKGGVKMRGINLENERLLVNTHQHTHQHTPTKTQRASEGKKLGKQNLRAQVYRVRRQIVSRGKRIWCCV